MKRKEMIEAIRADLLGRPHHRKAIKRFWIEVVKYGDHTEELNNRVVRIDQRSGELSLWGASDAEITSEEDITDRGLKAIGEALGLFIPKVEGPDIEIIGRAADTLGYSTNKL